MADELEIVHVDLGDGLRRGRRRDPRRVARLRRLADAPVAYVDAPRARRRARPPARRRRRPPRGRGGGPGRRRRAELLGAAALRRRPAPVAPLPAAVDRGDPLGGRRRRSARALPDGDRRRLAHAGRRDREPRPGCAHARARRGGE